MIPIKDRILLLFSHFIPALAGRFYWSHSDSKSAHFLRALRNILVYLNGAVNLEGLNPSHLQIFLCLFQVICDFYKYLKSTVIYSVLNLTLLLIYDLLGRRSFLVNFLLLTKTRSSLLAGIERYVFIKRSQRIFCHVFSSTYPVLYTWLLFVLHGLSTIISLLIITICRLQLQCKDN